MNGSVIFTNNALKLQGMRTPTFVLCKASRERIGTLRCVNRNLSVKYNDIGELTFDVYRFNDGEENEYYDLVKTSKYIYIPDIGYYRITDCNIQSPNTDLEYKSCTAQESSCTLMNKKLDTFTINMGTDESIDNVQFFNVANRDNMNSKEKGSLLDLILYDYGNCAEWEIGTIDPELVELQRSFEVTYQDVYSFLTQDVATAFDCVFFFDTLTNTISAYPASKCGKDTGIHISHKNLAKSFSIQNSDDDIVTGLRLEGEDSSVTVRELNMGYEIIFNLDYYHDPEYMSEGLYNAYTKWKQLWNDNIDEYTELLNGNTNTEVLTLDNGKLDSAVLGSGGGKITNGLLSLLAEETRLRYNMAADTAEGVPTTSKELLTVTNFSGYSLNKLNEFASLVENSMDVYSKLGYSKGTTDLKGTFTPENAAKYATYMSYRNKLIEIKGRAYVDDIKMSDEEKANENCAIWAVNDKINKLYTREGGINDIRKRMNEIISLVSMTNENNFTKTQLKELSEFIKVDELVDSNFVLTDSMEESDRQEMLKSFLEYGKTELNKKCQPTYQFTADLANLFELPEFEDYADEFLCGNNIFVTIHDNYQLKVKILSFDIDFDNRENFQVTFGNVMQQKETDIFTDITNAVDIANRTASSVSFNSSKWAQAADTTTEIGRIIEDGLLAAGCTLTDGSQSEVVVDKRGIFVKATSQLEQGMINPYPNDQIFLGGGRILFTSDNFKTVEEAIGRVTIKDKDGKETSVFGVIAKAIVAGLIMGTTIEGGSITGTTINNGNGTFKVTDEGVVTCTNITINGGSIDLKNSDNTSNASIKDGKLTAKNAEITGKIIATDLEITGNATIGGFHVNNTSLYSDSKTELENGNGILLSSIKGIGLGSKFRVDKEGNVTCKSIKITGSNGSSTVGGLVIDENGNLVAGANSSDGVAKNNIILDNSDKSTFGAIMIKYSNSEYFSLIRPYMEGNNNNIAYNAAGGNLYLGAFTTKKVVIGKAGENNKVELNFFYAEGESITCSSTVTADTVTANTVTANTVKASEFSKISDIRFKKNINNISLIDAYNTIMLLEPKIYELKSHDDTKLHHGFIAQEVQQTIDKNWGIISTKKNANGEDRLYIDYMELIPDLVGSIQYLSSQLTSLKSENEELKSRISNIESAIEKIQKGAGNV